MWKLEKKIKIRELYQSPKVCSPGENARCRQSGRKWRIYRRQEPSRLSDWRNVKAVSSCSPWCSTARARRVRALNGRPRPMRISPNAWKSQVNSKTSMPAWKSVHRTACDRSWLAAITINRVTRSSASLIRPQSMYVIIRTYAHYLP